MLQAMDVDGNAKVAMESGESDQDVHRASSIAADQIHVEGDLQPR